jgi:hypothetical protein
MNGWIVALMLAAGVSGWTYSKMSRRMGYGNTRSLWIVVGVAFVLVFLFGLTLIRYVIPPHK